MKKSNVWVDIRTYEELLAVPKAHKMFPKNMNGDYLIACDDKANIYYGNFNECMVKELCGKRFNVMPHIYTPSLHYSHTFVDVVGSAYHIPLWAVKQVWVDKGLYWMSVWKGGDDESVAQVLVKELIKDE